MSVTGLAVVLKSCATTPGSHALPMLPGVTDPAELPIPFEDALKAGIARRGAGDGRRFHVPTGAVPGGPATAPVVRQEVATPFEYPFMK
ncbi:hypothetical protein [Kitasatospora sp. NBC_00315]|uniref:hypothetical protein n=1 Tax=Kitasatospora sp. NBC_00315 TaxID=2975963 RepID=UPI003243E6A8